MCGILCLKSTDKISISLRKFLNNLNTLQHRGNNSFGYSYNNESGELVSKMVKGLVRNYNDLEINNISSNIFFKLSKSWNFIVLIYLNDFWAFSV